MRRRRSSEKNWKLTIPGYSSEEKKHPYHKLNFQASIPDSWFSDYAHQLRRTFMESCDLFELLAVIENFLLQRKVLVCGEVSADSDILSPSKLNLILNGNEIMLSEVVASAHLLIAGASLLASLCLAIDHIGFVCE
ncbi:hypothetical protein ACS0TY_016162 [Phlomoides rotata]